jgi:hypothetical protein
VPQNQKQPEKQKIAKLDPNGHELGEGHAVGQNEPGRNKSARQNTKIEQLGQILRERPSTLNHVYSWAQTAVYEKDL